MSALNGVHSLMFDSFFDETFRIAAPGYIPIEADVLRARTKTTGIYETRFTMGQLSIQSVLSIFCHHGKSCLPFDVACSTLVANEVKERSGYTALRTSPRSSFALR